MFFNSDKALLKEQFSLFSKFGDKVKINIIKVVYKYFIDFFILYIFYKWAKIIIILVIV